MSKLLKSVSLSCVLLAGAVQIAAASPLIYKPINPSFGGDPLNGNWLLAQGQGQVKGGSGSPGFSIDFPDFGDIGQDGVTDPTTLPPANPQIPATQQNNTNQ
jgi:curli production assembly/transport component CsgF